MAASWHVLDYEVEYCPEKDYVIKNWQKAGQGIERNIKKHIKQISKKPCIYASAAGLYVRSSR